MIIPGRALIARKIINNTLAPALQSQPCGVDLTLKRVLKWTSHGAVDFDNTLRSVAPTQEIPFQRPSQLDRDLKRPSAINQQTEANHEYIHLPRGSFLVEFNETVSVPLDVMGQLFVRSSLFRSGALLSAGVMDSGYEGAVGALLQVLNLSGIRLYRNSRLAQFVFHQMSEPVAGYDGVYQGKKSLS
ncbi:putative dUTP diphosphatase Dut [Bisporella sp. PMI_857]|nr:putative dUTP diphosphatase Dut [Bisporella sp. PMI_857]